MSDAALQAIYDDLPRIDCQGACHAACGPIDMTGLERRRIARVTGVDIPKLTSVFSSVRVEGYRCPALGMMGSCTVYEVRPLVCRIWGLTKRLPCFAGCRPQRWLSEPEAYELMARVWDVSGQPQEARLARLAAAEENQQAMSDIRDRLNLGWRP